MKDTALFAKLLELTPPWTVTSLEPDLGEKTITVKIEWPNGEKAPCPECESPCSIYDHREERVWRHLDTMQFKTILACPVPRVHCKTHGIKSMKVPWADMKGRFTALFERFAIDVLLMAENQSRAAQLLGLTWDEIHHIQERAVKRGLVKREFDGIEHVGIDEKSFLKGQSYVSVLYDLERSAVIDVVKGRTEDSAKQLLNAIPEDLRPEIKAAAVDMWPAFLTALQEVLPDTAIVHDKYHIVSYLNKAVDEVRRSEQKDLQGEEKINLKGSRYVWLRNPENWSNKEKESFNELKKECLRVGKAWSMKEGFRGIWNYVYEKSAKNFFAKWYSWVLNSKLTPMIKVAKMIKRHLCNVVSYVKHPITNAKAEGLNSKIQVIKAGARGFRNFLNYRTAILFYCGKLKLYP